MSKARLVIAAVIIEKRSPSEVAKSYGVARSWVYPLLDRYEAEGEAAFEPRSPTGLASRAASAGVPATQVTSSSTSACPTSRPGPRGDLVPPRREPGRALADKS